MGDLSAYFSLFFAAFLAATLIPAQSEALLVYLLSTTEYTAWVLIIVASVGNVLGSLINYLIGRGVEHYRNRKWFPVSDQQLNKAQHWYRKYGRWSLLASWIPIIGDPITMVAGILKEPISSFLILVTIAKISRYTVLALITLQFF